MKLIGIWIGSIPTIDGDLRKPGGKEVFGDELEPISELSHPGILAGPDVLAVPIEEKGNGSILAIEIELEERLLATGQSCNICLTKDSRAAFIFVHPSFPQVDEAAMNDQVVADIWLRIVTLVREEQDAESEAVLPGKVEAEPGHRRGGNLACDRPAFLRVEGAIGIVPPFEARL
jgi:hypothetical protein